MELVIPKVRLKTKQFPKWYTSDIIHQLKCLRTLRRKYRRSPTNHSLHRLNTAEALFNSNVESAKAYIV